MTHAPHDHDLGFKHDLPQLIGRRRLLSLLGGAGLASVAASPASAMNCVAVPWETAGPYPGDGTNTKNGQTVNVLTQSGVIREDIRPSFAGYSTLADGVRLDLEITLQTTGQTTGNCAPLEGHAMYLWHCDAVGRYSLYDTPEANYLRGVGISDAQGKLRFTTIVPGCYDGRWPHFHFEVFETAQAAVSGKASLLTAQIALPEAECAAVYAADTRYTNGTRNLQRITLNSDNVFADNSAEEIEQQMLKMTGDISRGYEGRVTIPIDLSADRAASMAPPPSGGFFGGPPPPKPLEK